MGVSSYDRDDVKVKGVRGGDSYDISSVDDNGKERLCVDAKVTDGDIIINPAITACPAYISLCLENGGSADMAVDGSSTPVDFEQGPGAGEIWFVNSIGMGLQDNGTNDAARFGNINGGLTNGLEIVQDISSTEYVYATIKNNVQIMSAFLTVTFGQSAGFINDANLFSGNRVFDPPIKLVGDNGDKIIARVNDDLTGINEILLRMTYWKDLS